VFELTQRHALGAVRAFVDDLCEMAVIA